ncbi:S-layer homology domain-containing protein [Aedoeadaptatus acetigenes]|uniref:S-layer homology domain-containing protein n=1 Tax=Aedoeadaptatus acetigenes TaxID=2981723 RepID=UPI0011DDD277|nr:S-layer homology domain-containing protein [Aedoeadaptatus acetigenes]
MKKNKAKAVATLALAGALLTTPFAAQAANFKDVGVGHWAYSYISKLSDLRIIKGYDDGTFKPLRNVSYLEILELLKGVQNPTSTEMTSAIATYGYIADAYKVPNWAKPAVCIALQNNVITEGNLKAAYKLNYINNVRNADQFPSRELALVYYAKALRIEPKKDTSNIKVTDIDSIGKTSKELIGDVDVKGLLASMIDAGIFNAFGTGAEFKGNLPLQRDQMAKITDTSYEYKSVKSFEGEVVAIVKNNDVPALTIKDKDGKTQAFVLSKDTVITINGKSAKAEDLNAGSKVKVKAFPQSGSIAPYQAVSVDVISTELSGVGMVESAKFDEIKIAYSTKKDAPIDESFKAEKTETFKLDKDATITSFGKKFDLKSLSSRDMVVFKAQDGVVKELEVIPNNGTVDGEFVSYTYNGYGETSTLVLKLANKKEISFTAKGDDAAKLSEVTKGLNKGYPLTLTTHYLQIKKAGVTEGKLEGFLVDVSNKTYGNGTIEIQKQDGNKETKLLAEKIDFKGLKDKQSSSINAYDLPGKLMNKKVYLELQVKGENVVAVTVKSELLKEDKTVNVKEVKRVNEGFTWNGGPVIASTGKTYGEYEFTLEDGATDFKDKKFRGLVEIDEFDKMRGTNSLTVVYDLYKDETEGGTITNLRVMGGSSILPIYRDR